MLVLVCGPPVDGDLAAARATIAAGIERLLPFAADHGVRLGIEPLHPMMVGERSAIVTLGEALALARGFDDPAVGVVVDAYHVFWDPRLERRARRRSRADRRLPRLRLARPDARPARRPRADGRRDHRPPAHPRARSTRAGYDGPIEVEVINPALATMPGDELLADIALRFSRG